MRKAIFILAAALSFAAPSRAEDKAQTDAEQLSRDMITNVDGLIGQLGGKISSDKPVTDSDLDAVFNDSFFASSDDPVRDLDAARARLGAKAGDKAAFNGTYDKWVSSKLYPSEFSPEVSEEGGKITVTLDVPDYADDPVRVNVAKGRIKIYYEKQEVASSSSVDGGESYASSTKGQHRVMPVPKGANPAKYKIVNGDGTISVIFDRLKKGGKQTEASK